MLKPTSDFDSAELELYSMLAGREARCPPLGVLLALEQDVLPADLAGSARAHLARCGLCKMLLEDMASLPDPELPVTQQDRIAASLPMRRTRSALSVLTRGLIGLAATVLLVAGLFFWTHRRQQVEIARVEPVQTPLALQAKELPFAPLASPSRAAALVTRGGGANGEPTNEQLLPAFKAYNHSDFGLAAVEFQALSADYPQNQMILLYLGVSQLSLGQNAQADVALKHARDAKRLYNADAVLWYSAVAASRTQPAEARPFLLELCQKKTSPYSTQSCEALQTSGMKS